MITHRKHIRHSDSISLRQIYSPVVTVFPVLNFIERGKYLSILVLEGQSYIDYSMIFRVMKTECYSAAKIKRKC